MKPIVNEETPNNHVRITPNTTISLGLLVVLIGMALGLLAGGISVCVKADSALPREQAALTYATKAELQDSLVGVQAQMDRRFTGIDRALTRIEDELKSHDAAGR